MSDDTFEGTSGTLRCKDCDMLFSHEMGGFTHGETFSCPNCGKEHTFHQHDIETIRREIEKIENSKLDVEP